MRIRARLALTQAVACDQGPPPVAEVVSATGICLLPMNPAAARR